MTQPFESCPELPAPPGRILLFATFAIVFGVGLAIWIERPKGPICQGVLTARTTSISAPSNGTLAEFLVPEGGEVQIGDPLLRIVDEVLEQSIASKINEIESLQLLYDRTTAAAELELAWRQRTLDAEICEIQLQSAAFLKEKYDFEMQQSMLNDVLSGQRLAMADPDHTFVTSLSVSGHSDLTTRMTTLFEMELAANAIEVSSAQVEICGNRQKQLELIRSTLPAQVRLTEGVDVAEANLKRAQCELEKLQAQKSELTINSPAIGRVGVFQCQTGSRLTEGTPIVELLDDAHRYLVVQVSSKDIVEFTLGQKLNLTFPGNQHRSGKVTLIAPQAQQSANLNDSTVEIQVEQSGRLWPVVPIGSRVEVKVDYRG